MNGVSIREATAADVPAIVEFALALAHESEQIELDASTVTRGALGFIDQPGYGFYLMAEDQGEVVGSIMITFEYSDWRDGVYWWVQSVYVRPQHRRRGIYRKLYEAAKQRAARQGNVRGFRLYVASHNLLARKVYRSLGMGETYYQVMEETPAERESVPV